MTFTDERSCNGDVVEGESYRIVRSDGSDDPSVRVDPLTSWTQVSRVAAVVAAAVLVAGLLIQGGRAAWRRWIRPTVTRRRNRAADV